MVRPHETVTREELIAFLRTQPLVVEASIGPDGPQAAVVQVMVTDQAELVFDTVASTRKFANLSRDPRIAIVSGGLLPGDERTAQYEGTADMPTGDELAELQEAYFARHPEGRERLGWPGITYVRVRPKWIRYSDFNKNPPLIVEFRGPDLL